MRDGLTAIGVGLVTAVAVAGIQYGLYGTSPTNWFTFYTFIATAGASYMISLMVRQSKRQPPEQ